MTREHPALGRSGVALLLATVFASGTAVMIVEMTAVRAVQPFFGSTTWVWTNVIAVVLAALALGYALGGRLADRRASPTLHYGLLYGLLGAGGVLVALCALLVTPVARLFLTDGVDLEGVVSVLLWGSLGTALMLFAPPILLLGTVAPIAIRLLARHGVGRAVGSVFALSTVGSILGTYLPTLVLVPRLGSRGSILVAAGILLVTSASGLLVLGRRRRPAAVGLLLLGVASWGAGAVGLVPPARPAPPLVGGVATVLAEVESPYQYLTVREDVYDDGVERVLTINEGVTTWHALKVLGRVLTGSGFHDAYAALPFLLDRDPGDRLDLCVVGLACGVNAAQWHHFFAGPFDLHVEGAELDPVVLDLGRRYFDLPSDEVPWLQVHVLDGRSLLESLPSDRRFHTILLDAFSNELYVPFHLATREFFELCARRLEDGGLLAMNVYARGDEAPNLLAIENTMAHVFPTVLRVPHDETGGYLLLARRAGGPFDLARLEAASIRERFAARTETPEWDDLVHLADELRIRAARRGGVPVPDPMRRILTDDDAPLEWLTDAFLQRSEAALRAAGDARSSALLELRAKQTRWLVGIGLGWSALLLVLLRVSCASVTEGARRSLPP